MENNFTKLVTYYKKYQLPLTIIVSMFLLFLSTLWQPLMYVLMLFLLVSMIFSSVQDILCLTFFLLPFSGFLIIFIGSSIFIFVVILTKYIIAVIKKQQQIYKLPLLITLAIIIVFSAIFYGTTDYGALQGVLIICIFLFVYLVFAYRKQINAEQCLEYLFYGLIVSALMGLVLYYIPIAKMFAYKDWSYGLTVVKEHIIHDSGKYKRLLLLSFHENHLYAFCILGIAYVSYYFLGKQKKAVLKVLINLFGLGVMLAVGVLTLSKAFIILLFLSLLLFLVMAVVIHKKHSLKFVLPAVVIGVVMGLVFKDEFVKVFERFNGSGSSSTKDFDSLLNSITTGRWKIWQEFAAATFSTPQKALFGVGIFSADVVDVGPHNLYIALLYRFGIMGVICLGVLVWSYYYSLDEKLHFNVLGLIPLILFLAMALQEACLDERLYFLVIAIMLLFNGNKDTQTQTIDIEEKTTNKGGK